jgi:predicted enzyme related to lactoylglutathione lyase
MNKHESINYVEFPSRDLEVSKHFFSTVFGWDFIDYGPDYAAISGAGLDGGFYRSDKTVDTDNGSALVVLYSNKLEDTRDKIVNAGGTIKKEIFSFPGGRRFHFCDPNGNEYAVWSDLED